MEHAVWVGEQGEKGWHDMTVLPETGGGGVDH